MTIDPLDVVSSTADAAFGTDEEGRIVIWNRAAEKLLGFEAAEVLGKPCEAILCGKDVFGNRFCDVDCALHQMVRRHEAIRHFELDLVNASGDFVHVGVSTIVIPGPKRSQYTIIHLLQPKVVDWRSERKAPNDPLDAAAMTPPATGEPAPLFYNLTSRELEVLRLVGGGASSQQIADTLFISVTTARNHVQNILRKLDVHSKLEAVSIALRHRLI